MKRILILVLALMPNLSIAQEKPAMSRREERRIEDSLELMRDVRLAAAKAKWKNQQDNSANLHKDDANRAEGIKNTAYTQEEILNYILAYDVFDNVVTHGNMIAANIKPTKLDCTTLGYTRNQAPIYLLNGGITGRIIFRFKPGKYKYEILNLRFIDLRSSFYGITTYFSEGKEGYGYHIVESLVNNFIDDITTFNIPEDSW